VDGANVRRTWLGLHLVLVLLIGAVSESLLGDSDPAHLLIACTLVRWFMAALAALTLMVALAPWRAWVNSFRKLGVLWIYAAVAAAAAASSVQIVQKLWAPTAGLTFHFVRALLTPLIDGLQADAHTRILSSDRFSIEITQYCSGLEGIGLLIAFCSAWLLCFHREFIFPRALILLPICILVAFLVNVVRIAALMLIGYAGYPDVAMYGFHSQAGWIAFNSIAALVAVSSRRSKWLNRSPSVGLANAVAGPSQLEFSPQPAYEGQRGNPTAVYLLPLLAIVAAGMLSRSFSGKFEVLYGLRLLGASGALAWGWPVLKRLNWRFSWRGVAVGAMVALIWIGVGHFLLPPQNVPVELAAMTEPNRLTWLAIRIATAVITIPLAEELAFRGYAMRRLTSVSFDTLNFRCVGGGALLLSAAIFGIDHGAMWLPATLGGAVYGGLLVRTERIGEPVSAHATANALVALYVLGTNQWQFW
jgi:exosortase E/protease (VPEID-CTERM system)